MRELLACQTSNNQDVNSALSANLNKQLMEAKSSTEDAFVAAMFRASAFLVTSEGTVNVTRAVTKHNIFSKDENHLKAI